MKKGEWVFSGVLLAVVVCFLVGSLNITSLSELSLTSPGGYPVFISILGLVFAGWVLWETRKEAATQQAPDDVQKESGVFNRDVFCVIGLMALYLLCIYLLHYVISTLLFVFLTIQYLHRKSLKLSATVAYISTFMTVLAFKYVFNIILP